jgi:NitT/TauT family transport system substrate-binding protein
MTVERSGRRWRAAWALVLAGALAACGGGRAARTEGPVTLRLGYFPNVTHAPAMIGLDAGLFAKELGRGVTIEAKSFNAGPDVVTAIFSDALDISYVGPNPAINAFQKSNGRAIRIIAGAASGGAALVVKPSIRTPADLRGKTLASPQLGNTQDVALRAWLKAQGFATTPEGGGDVHIKPQANAQTLETFKAGQIDGAWVPEPWATRLVLEAGGRVLVDERSLWPEGQFVTTLVIVRTAFAKEHPDVVSRFIRGHVAAVDFANERPQGAQRITNAAIERLTGKALKPEVIEGAWRNLTFTVDPIASSLRKSAKDAEAVGLLEPVDLRGIFDLAPLNAVLRALGRAPVSAGDER